jgi:hypothetical protein
MNKLLNGWYEDLRKEIKTNNTDYAEYMKKHFVHGGKSKVSLEKLIKISGTKVVINKNTSENRYKIGKHKYVSSIAHIYYSKGGGNPKYDEINLSMTFIDNKTKNNKRDLVLFLLHEITHGILHRIKTVENVYRDEIEAQTVAHIVGKYLGLKENVSSSMINYLKYLRKKYYQKNPDVKKEYSIRKTKIIKTSQKIINCIEENKIIYDEFFQKILDND